MTHDTRRPLAGILWMVGTGLCFVGVTAFVKLTGGRVPAAEAAFLRYIVGLVFLIPMANKLMAMRLTKRQWQLVSVRGLVHSIGVILWFYAMARIPMAEVTAMNYLTPIYVSVLAIFVLGEHMAFRRIVATAVALVGALIILRPGFRALDPGHFAMLGTTLLFSGSYLTAKLLTEDLDATLIVALLSITVSIGLAPFALMEWVTPTLVDLLILSGVACFATAGHYCMTRAFASAPVTVTQPVTFLQLIWSAAVGALFFSEAIDIWVVVGALLILGSATFIAWREAVLKRSVMPPVNAAKF